MTRRDVRRATWLLWALGLQAGVAGRAVPQTAAVLLLAAGVASPARAQSPWDAVLDITAYPSPYLSDWEANPTIATLTITNPTAADQNVLLVYRVTDQGGRVVASGRSDPMLIVSGPPTVITDFVNLPGTSQHDQGFEDQMRRTGRLPEGDQTICVAVTDQGGFVLAEDCVTFSVVYPDPPYLIGPIDDQLLTSGSPVFQWTPLQVPPAFQLTYVLRISEVLEGQAPEHALVANIPLFETTTFGTNFEYSIGAPPLEDGKSYVWRVQALDQNGYAAAANEGRSEIWNFQLGDPGGGGPVGGGLAVTLEVDNTFYGDDSGEDDVVAASDAALRDVPAAEDDTVAYLALCSESNWRESRPVRIRTFSPVGFPRRLAAPAKLFRFKVSGSESRVWALVGDTQKGKRVMAYGDCDGLGLPLQRWVGIRTVEGSAATASLMAGNLPQGEVDSTNPGLEFGIVIITLENTTVAAPDGFEIVRSFLEGHDIEAKPGVTTFGVMQLAQRPFWQVFEFFGYDQKEIELQGFVGLGNKLSLGFAGNSKDGTRGGDVSAELEFVNLRAALPERTPILAPVRALVKSSHIEFEFAVTDTVRKVFGDSSGAQHQFHLLFNIKHRLQLSDDLVSALNMNEGAEWIGTLGLDLSTEQFKKGTAEAKIVIRYTLGATWSLGSSKFVVGNPELEVGVLVGGANRGDVMFTLSATAGWGEEAGLGKIAVTLARSEASLRAQAHPAYLARGHANVQRWQERLDFTREELVRATTAADSTKLQGYIAQYEGWIAEEQEQIKSFESLNTTRRLREQQQAANPEPHCGKLKGWYCGFRASFGNASAVDILALLREIVFTIATRLTP